MLLNTHFAENVKEKSSAECWVNNPTLGEFCFGMIGRVNIAINAWLVIPVITRTSIIINIVTHQFVSYGSLEG